MCLLAVERVVHNPQGIVAYRLYYHAPHEHNQDDKGWYVAKARLLNAAESGSYLSGFHAFVERSGELWPVKLRGVLTYGIEHWKGRFVPVVVGSEMLVTLEEKKLDGI